MTYAPLHNQLTILGNELIDVTGQEPFDVEDMHPDVKQYLTHCIATEDYLASGVNVLGASLLVEENHPDAAPGGPLQRYGYMVIAVSVGGNAIVLSKTSGTVYWADHGSFNDDGEISYMDRTTGDWNYLTWSTENVRKCLVLLAPSAASFLLEALTGSWEKCLDELDV